MIWLIGFISTVIYFWNIMYDTSHNKTIKPYLGYATISLLCLYQVNQPLFYIMLFGVFIFTILVYLKFFESE